MDRIAQDCKVLDVLYQRDQSLKFKDALQRSSIDPLYPLDLRSSTNSLSSPLNPVWKIRGPISRFGAAIAERKSKSILALGAPRGKIDIA